MRRARDLGFWTERIKKLLALWGDNRKSDARVREVAEGHVAELEAQARDLQEMIWVLDAYRRSLRQRRSPSLPNSY